MRSNSQRPRPATIVPSLAVALSLAAAMTLAAGLCAPGQAQESAQAEKGNANAATGVTPDPGSCEKVPEAIRAAEPAQRLALSRVALRRPCRPMPDPIQKALGSGVWEDGKALDSDDRANLLAVAANSRYPAAETLIVRILETGRWPENAQLGNDDGASLVRALKPAMSPYRAHLLLDIFEQVPVPVVRLAVLETLRGLPLDEAILPAVEAYYEETGATQQAGLTTLNGQPEKTPPEVLARLIRSLPEGAMLEWAIRLGNRHPTAEVAAAMKARGVPAPGNPKH